MPIRQFRPVTASSRFRSVPDFSEITRAEPEKALVEPLKKSAAKKTASKSTKKKGK